MGHSPSLEIYSRTVTLKFICSFWSPKVHYRVRKCPIADPGFSRIANMHDHLKTGFGIHSVALCIGNGCSLSAGKAAQAWSLQFSFIHYRGLKSVELHTHISIRRHGVVENYGDSLNSNAEVQVRRTVKTDTRKKQKQQRQLNLVHFSIIKMECICSSEFPRTFRTTRHYNPEGTRKTFRAKRLKHLSNMK
jgi:hypothetical protein